MGAVGRRPSDRAIAAQADSRVRGLGPRTRPRPGRNEPRSHYEQGPRTLARCPLLGLGTGTDRYPVPLPQAKGATRCCRRHYLTKAEISALYFATHQMKRPRGWDSPFPVGRYWRAALVVFFNYGVDTGTVWKSASFHEPILWRHVTWEPQSPDREVKERSRWGWLFYRRVKTG